MFEIIGVIALIITLLSFLVGSILLGFIYWLYRSKEKLILQGMPEPDTLRHMAYRSSEGISQKSHDGLRIKWSVEA